ncbi:unnamed protein product [Didymodactylos carnosus]|uniref:Uncharacterized protein n=3 Tax=Didymodactylos carnosus TaxID=1234261 RepID=A0A814T2F8_9BILA|nr:unnamed protein product [Didymodactylos carnosus]CAF3919234.1 unnamed protein product [Didymodactylos carnosus]
MLFEALPKPFKDLYNHKCKYHVNDDNSITFYPSPFLKNDKIATKKLDKELFIDSNQLKYFKEKLNISELEGVDDWNCNIIKKSDNYHGFIRAIEIAFFQHYPISIKPSDLWLLILQGIAFHVNKNSEKLRDKYVYHKSKKSLEVIRQGFIKGSKKNDYNSVINEFIEQIDKNTIPDTVKLLKNDFTTSNNIDDIATKLCIMDICQCYFSYRMIIGCGFPSITLNGIKDDWINLYKKCEELLNTKVDGKFSEKWKLSLLPVLNEFINVYNCKIDCVFWNSMIKRGGFMSGILRDRNKDARDVYERDHYCGWINVFFPYLFSGNTDIIENDACVPYSMNQDYVYPQRSKTFCMNDDNNNSDNIDIESAISFPSRHGARVSSLPIGLSQAPVVCIDLNTNQTYDLIFAAGFTGVQQDDRTLTISPQVGWFIGQKEKKII